VLIVGENEVASDTYALKNIETANRLQSRAANLAATIQRK